MESEVKEFVVDLEKWLSKDAPVTAVLTRVNVKYGRDVEELVNKILYSAAEKRKVYPVVTTQFITVYRLGLCVVNVEFEDLTVTLWNGAVYKKFEGEGLCPLDEGTLSAEHWLFIKRLIAANGGWKLC